MKLPFVNRRLEINELNKLSKRGGLVVIFGRRRIGKTRLLIEWLNKVGGIYTQALEAAPEIQIKQIYEDIKDRLNVNIEPKNWKEFFELLDIGSDKNIICIDEFPYLVDATPSLPSIIQKWFDHRKNHSNFLILTGSSQRMMHGLFLDRDTPLFGRSQKIIKFEPMRFSDFCNACGLEKFSKNNFVKFSLVGGIPKYWEFVEYEQNITDLAEELYFGFAPYMENEPVRILTDEKINGIVPINLLEAIGRGASKPTEMANRLNTIQTNISRPLQLLNDLSIITREIPFGESSRTSKKVLYTITDPTIRFWFNVYSPHRTKWKVFDKKKKEELLNIHASTVFEDQIRSKFDGAMRYWEKNLEFDMVRSDRDKNSIIISEVKFKSLEKEEKKRIFIELKNKFQMSKLRKKYEKVKYEVFDLSFISEL